MAIGGKNANDIQTSPIAIGERQTCRVHGSHWLEPVGVWVSLLHALYSLGSSEKLPWLLFHVHLLIANDTRFLPPHANSQAATD